jgi:uncharacterized protein involved in outer membrane biogenesis
VKRFIRIALLAAGAIVALCAIALIGLNLYVQSQGTQARIQQELSQRLGTELHINAVSVTPWGGLTLNGISIPQAWPGNSGDFLTAKSFHLHVSFVSLFSRRLLITKVSLLEPTVVWPQNADGKWRLPGERREETSKVQEAATSHSPPPPPQPASPPVEAEATVAPIEPEQPPDAGKRTVASKPRKPTTELIPDVQRLAVTGANFRFLDKSGTMVATFGGVDLHATVHDVAALRGNAKIEKVSLRDRLFLDTLQSPLRYDSKQLELSRISARAAGGNVAGAFAINPETHDSPFSVSVKFREVQADQLVVEAGGPSGVVRGKLEGSFEATGKTSDADEVTWGQQPSAARQEGIFPSLTRRNAAKDPANHRQNLPWQSQHLRRSSRRRRFSRPRSPSSPSPARFSRSPVATRFRLWRGNQAARRARV